MHIAFAASECVPFSKTGGLADVIGALPPALVNLGHKATVFLPRYRSTKLENPPVVIPSITVPFDDRYRFCSVLDGGVRSGVQFYFIEYPPFFDRDGLYGTAIGDYHDNAERFALFSRAVLEATKILGAPDVLHCHDWQTALVPILLKTHYTEDPAFATAPCVFTIHNLGYQGLFPPEILPLLMLPWDLFTMSKLEFYGKVNFLKGAIAMADFITTVSRKYSQEIQTAEYGFGLEGVLRARGNTIAGILNAVDYLSWNPETDPYIAGQYSAADVSGKKKCKADLLKEFGLAQDTQLPVVGMVSRFVPQKGFDLVQQVGDRLALEDLILIVLGTGQREYEDMFRRLNKQFPQKIGARIAYDDALAHKIEAGSDIYLMPSHYEPCGLNQIYSMKYGSVPVVRATGGLDDTVEQFDPKTLKGTGFKFREYTGEIMLDALRAAIALYRSDQNAWRALMRNGMAQDYSWMNSAREYVRVYERARQVKQQAVSA
ncbi:MAG TPA: glycogen synthase GlgA [Terriglobales bacterium]|jgi:starch synthase|nr:glycogen synthase GlgA [Terriglobales bacterium]